MLEKIGALGYEMLSSPDQVVLDVLNKILENKPRDSVVYYEIGVGIGATVRAVSKIMNNEGKIYLFSFERELFELAGDLANLGYDNINTEWGSPSQLYSGYHFQLAKAFVINKLPLFDIAYIDGGHVFHLDAPAACILKEVCKPGGYMLFDDWTWSIEKSPSMKPSVRPSTALHYDSEQIKEQHVKLVCKVIMDTDLRFNFLGIINDTAVYQKKMVTTQQT